MNTITLTIRQAEEGGPCAVDFQTGGSGTVLDLARAHAVLIHTAALMTAETRNAIQATADGWMFDAAFKLELDALEGNERVKQTGYTRFREVEGPGL